MDNTQVAQAGGVDTATSEVLPPSQDGNSPDGNRDASASGGSDNAASTNATTQEGSMDAGVYYINGYPSAYVYDYACGGENSPSSPPAFTPPPAQLQTLKFHKQLLFVLPWTLLHWEFFFMCILSFIIDSLSVPPILFVGFFL
jgi:hypothetical protein